MPERTLRNLLLAGAALLAATVLHDTARATDCKLIIDADFPVTYAGLSPIVTVEIKHHPLRMMVDSGSTISYLSAAAYNMLGIEDAAHLPGGYVNGSGGTVQMNTFVEQDMNFGAVTLHDEVLPVSDQYIPKEHGKPIADGIIGYDILQFFDIGLDLPDHKITFYTARNCASVQTPWIGTFAPAAFTRPHDDSPEIPVTINGQSFNLVVDTGADSTGVTQAALTRLGVKPEAMAPQTGTGTGFGDENFRYRNMEFADVAIGAEDFSDDWVLVDSTKQADLDADMDGFLGEDYLSTHRVFISNATATVYLGLSQP